MEKSIEHTIISVIEKIKTMYKYNNNIYALLETEPKIQINITEDNKIVLTEIEYLYYDSLIITKNKIIYKSDSDKHELTLYDKYNSWEELINLK